MPVGAVAIAFSGILFRLSHVSASTGAFYRCFLALPPLWFLARRENRRFAALILSESPSWLQLAGAGCILVGLVVATVARRDVPAPEPELAG